MRTGCERREPRVVERRDDQQDRIRAERTRLGNLVLVDDEFLAQDRQQTCIACLDQELGRALEERSVGQHREARRLRPRVRRSDARGIEFRTQQSLARARALDLGNDGGGAASGARSNRFGEPARCSGGTCIAIDGREGARDLRRDHLLRLRGQDPGEDVAVAHL